MHRALAAAARLSVAGLWLLAGTPCVGLAAADLDIPQPCHLYWPGGPPNLDPFDGGGGNFVAADTDQRYLAVQTGRYYLEWDVIEGRVNRFLPFASSGEADAACALQHVPLPAAPGHGRITWTLPVGRFAVTTAYRTDYTPEFFPVHIVESGPWFQHFAIHDLALTGEVPDGLEGDFWLEVMAWPDRVSITLRTLDQRLVERLSGLEKSRPAVNGIPDLQPGEPARFLDQNGRKVYLLSLLQWHAEGAATGEVFVGSEDPAVSAHANPVEGIPQIRLAKLVQPPGAQTPLGTPVQFGLGRDYAIRIRNPSGRPERLDMRIDLPDNRSLTGHSLMLLDSGGNQTGVPVQISKNWHIKQLDRFLPYMGTWSHGRVSLVVPAGFDEALTLRLIKGDYGDYHAASIAQLSLIGWGGNGFWIQAALGSWGETLCLQPGRVLRRTYMTDWRPFMSRAIDGGTHDWSANAGGGDLFVYFNERGDYVPFVGNKHLITRNGPCLAELEFHEISKDRRVEVRGTWSLPMSNDFARTYLKVRCDFLGDVDFSRFSILQMGADRYNPTGSPRGAFGSGSGILHSQSFTPGLDPRDYLSDPVPLEGGLPWITLYGDRLDAGARIGQAQRIAVVRGWNAVVGGAAMPAPAGAFYNSFVHGEDSFHAELVPGTLKGHFRSGDFIEMVLEFVLVPLSPETYYGDNALVHRLLESHANDWRMAREIAAGNDLRLLAGETEIRGPLPVVGYEALLERFKLSGTTALVPLTISGIPSPGRLVVIGGAPAPADPPQQWRRCPDGTWQSVVILDPSRLPDRFAIRHEAGAD